MCQVVNEVMVVTDPCAMHGTPVNTVVSAPIINSLENSKQFVSVISSVTSKDDSRVVLDLLLSYVLIFRKSGVFEAIWALGISNFSSHTSLPSDIAL